MHTFLVIYMHQNRVCISCCPDEFPAGYYWYAGKCKGTGAPPKWVENLLDQLESSTAGEKEASETSELEKQKDLSGNEMDKLQDIDTDIDTGQFLTLDLPKRLHDPEFTTHSESLQESLADLHDHALVELS